MLLYLPAFGKILGKNGGVLRGDAGESRRFRWFLAEISWWNGF
jgi:hypothetical protein